MNNRTTLLSLLSLITGLFLSACVMPPSMPDETMSVPIAPLKLKMPMGAAKKATTPFMVALLDSINTQAARMASNLVLDSINKIQEQKISDITLDYVINQYEWDKRMYKTRTAYSYKIRKYLQADLEQLLIEKNIRVLGRFGSKDEMTFDEKKRAIYTLSPEITIKVHTKSTRKYSGSQYIEEGDMIVNADIFLTLRESMTGEKLWIKHFEVGPTVKPYKVSLEYFSSTSSSASTGREADDPRANRPPAGTASVDSTVQTAKRNDNTDEILASAIAEFYTLLGGQLKKQIDPEEWEKYIDEADNLRKQIRY